MRLLKVWQLSYIPYKEVVFRSIAEEKGRMWWGGFGRGNFGKDIEDDLALNKKALRIAKWDKTLVAIFNILAAVFPFMARFFGSPLLGLTSAVSLSLAVTFGFMVLYAVQTLSSFVSTESSTLLSTLPLKQNEFSLITFFSFIRSIDYLVVGSIISQVLLVAYHTASPLAVLVMFFASVINTILAVAIALWFSKIFIKNLSMGGRSKTTTLLRLFFIFMWGVLLFGVSLLISLPWYIVPSLELMLLNTHQLYIPIFCLFYPFSAGLAVTTINNSVYFGSTTLFSIISLIGYGVVAGLAGKWILKTIERISKGIDFKKLKFTTNDFSIKTHIPLLGYIIKDLKISSRNPATAFFFALPILETIIIFFLLANFVVIRASTLLVSTFMGGFFVLLMPLALLNAEGKGLDYTKTLPLNINQIIISKTVISTLTYIPVLLIFVIMTSIKSTTSPITILIPFFEIIAIIAASFFEVHLFLNSVTKGRISALIHDLKKLIVGITTLLIPLVVYSVVYLISFSHILAILCIGVTSVLELGFVFYLVKCNMN